jgi:hypothetical protein
MNVNGTELDTAAKVLAFAGFDAKKATGGNRIIRTPSKINQRLLLQPQTVAPKKTRV